MAVPGWLQAAWAGACFRGSASLTPVEIDAEIAEHRNEQSAPVRDGGYSEI
jgi:hypothetical protein